MGGGVGGAGAGGGVSCIENHPITVVTDCIQFKHFAYYFLLFSRAHL